MKFRFVVLIDSILSHFMKKDKNSHRSSNYSGCQLSYEHPPFQWEERFSWGEIQLNLQVQDGRIAKAKVYSDAMDWSIAPKLEKALTGCRFSRDALREAIAAAETGVEENLYQMLETV